MATKQQKITGGLGAGLAAAAAAAAGYYFYGAKNAGKHRRTVAKWARDFKNEAVREVKKLKTLDAATIAGAVDTAALAYQNLRSVSRTDLRRASGELKRNWEELKREAGGKRQAATHRIRTVRARVKRRKSR
jgi:RNA 3'-terminal phosphate cyclase